MCKDPPRTNIAGRNPDSLVQATKVSGGTDMLKCAGRQRIANPMHEDGIFAFDMPCGAIGPNDSDGRDV